LIRANQPLAFSLKFDQSPFEPLLFLLLRCPIAGFLTSVVFLDFGILKWALPSFWCKRRGSFLIGASQLLITVSALRLASIQPRLLFSTSRISLFHL